MLELFKDDRAGAVEKNSVLCKPANRLGESLRFDVLTHRNQFVLRVAVSDSYNVLFDDRPFVEVGGNEVCGSAN